jgi:PmbA protein
MTGDALEIGGILLEEAANLGAAAADVFVKLSAARETSLPSLSLGHAMEQGVALRVFLQDGRSALSATTLPERENGPASLGDDLRALARRAFEVAAHGGPLPLLDLPPESGADGRGLGLLDPDIEGPAEALAELSEQIHGLASEVLPGATARVRLQTVASSVHLMNSSGFGGSYRHTLARLDLQLEASKNGRRAASRLVRASRSLRGLSADAAVAEAFSVLEESLVPRLSPAGIHQVILAPRAAAEIASGITGWISRGRWSDDLSEEGPRRGERIGSSAITITDDGRLPGGISSAPFDGEGTATRRTVLVERGVTRDILRDLRAGSSLGGSTGNGMRASFREPPILRPTNLFINPGHVSPAEVASRVRQGIRISTLGRVPPVRSLDSPFAVPFTGRWMHRGREGAPLAGGYLAATLREILQEVEVAASDLVFTHRRGSYGSPTLLLRRAPIRSA